MVREITLGNSDALDELSQRVGDGSSTDQETVAAKNRTYVYGGMSSVAIPPNLNRHETRKFLAQSRKSQKKRR